MAFSLSLSAPSSIFDKPPKFSSSSLEAITSQLTSLPARPGLVESFNLLWDAGFEVYAITNGGVESTAKLLRSVENGGERWVDKFGAKGEDDGEKGKEWVISCDDVKKAKPAPEVVSSLLPHIPFLHRRPLSLNLTVFSLSQYAHLLSRSKASPSSGDLIYLIAAHTWDLLSARKAGFKTAWVNYEEVVECEELFGVADVKGGGLKEVVEEIVRRSG